MVKTMLDRMTRRATIRMGATASLDRLFTELGDMKPPAADRPFPPIQVATHMRASPDCWKDLGIHYA